MGQVIALELGAVTRRALADTKGQGATVCILPVIRIERAAEIGADTWQGMPSDSAPAYAAPDHDDA